MLRQDYILREIERTVEFCLRALGLKKRDTVQELEEFLEENSESLTGLPLRTLLETPANQLVMLLYHPGTAKLPQLVSSGAWLCEAADVRLLTGRGTEACDLYLRGAEILAFVQAQHGSEREFAPIAEHLDRLRSRIADYPFTESQRSRAEALLGLHQDPPPSP